MRAAPHVQLPHQSAGLDRIGVRYRVHLVPTRPTSKHSEIAILFFFLCCREEALCEGRLGKEPASTHCEMASSALFSFRLCQEKTPDPFYSILGVGFGGNRIAEFQALVAPPKPPSPPPTPKPVVTAPSNFNTVPNFEQMHREVLDILPLGAGATARLGKVGLKTIQELIRGKFLRKSSSLQIEYVDEKGPAAAQRAFDALTTNSAVKTEETSKGIVRSAEIEGGGTVTVRDFSTGKPPRPTIEVRQPGEMPVKKRF